MIWMIFFADGSNHYLYKGTEEECMREFKHWRKSYDIKIADPTPAKVPDYYILTEMRSFVPCF
ncbi:MAG: hypothetical protein LUH57_07375 [Ruminococcus sp.]|nr:hypothetical protein [Ruminococcus sp.]